MPANLTPEYLEAEERFREAEDRQKKIDALQEMLSRLPKHKGTEKIEADIRRRLSNLKNQSKKKTGPTKAKTPDQIEPEGAGQVVIAGLPNTGKSALVDALTNATPKVADFPLSTYGPTVGMMRYEDIQIQLVDLPPLSEEHVETWVFNLIRKADLVVLLIDSGSEDPKEELAKTMGLLEEEAIYLFPPDADFQANSVGRTNNKGLLVAAKNDGENREKKIALLKEETDLPVTPFSMLDEDYMDQFRREVYQSLGLIRIYTKKPGKEPDLDEPYLLDRGSTVMDAARSIHKDLAQDLDYVRIWGSGRFDGQQVAQDHVLEEGDVIEIHRK